MGDVTRVAEATATETAERSVSGVAPTPAGSSEYDLYVAHAPDDEAFVQGLLADLGVPRERVMLFDLLRPGGDVISEIARGVVRSRYTLVVLSAAFFADRYAQAAARLVTFLSESDPRVVPVIRQKLKVPPELGLALESRVPIDLRDPGQRAPYPCRVIVTGRDQARAIRAEQCTQHRTLVSEQYSCELARENR